MAKVRYQVTGTGRCPSIALSGEGLATIENPNGGSVKLVCSPDDGTTWNPVYASDGGEFVYTDQITFVIHNHGPMLYSLDTTSFGSSPFWITLSGD